MTSTNETKVMVACCGLVCSECGMHKKGRCDGCRGEKNIFQGCPVKKCAAEKSFETCAECREFSDLKACRKLNNFISKIIGFIFRTNRIENLNRIRSMGLPAFRCERGER